MSSSAIQCCELDREALKDTPRIRCWRRAWKHLSKRARRMIAEYVWDIGQSGDRKDLPRHDCIILFLVNAYEDIGHRAERPKEEFRALVRSLTRINEDGRIVFYGDRAGFFGRLWYLITEIH